MFGSHKGHEVEPIEDGYLRLRGKIEYLMDQQVLNLGSMRDRLVEVGHCKRMLVEKRNSLLLQTDRVFDEIIKIVKDRKNFLKSRGLMGGSNGQMI
jgi:hypothetical protein